MGNLHSAARDGDVDKIKSLVKGGLFSKGSNVNEQDDLGFTPVHWAAFNGHVECIKVLASLGADLNKAALWGIAPVHWAAAKGHVECIKVLASLKADINVEVKDGYTPVYVAAYNGRVESIKVLASLGADINIAANIGKTPVYIAAQEGHVECIKVLASLGADINIAKKNGKAPVYIAAAKGHVECIKVLASLKADLNIAEIDGRTPVYIAAAKGHVECIKVLASLGADINIAKKIGTTPICIAACNGHVECIKVLASLGADINTATKNGKAPVYIAAQEGHVECIKVLASLGANINIAEEIGETPVYIAAAKGRVECIKVLASLGADIHKAANIGETPVYIAAAKGHVECIKVLASLGANINIAKKDGEAPVYIAAANGRVECIKVLASLGADINIAEENGATPVYIAAANGHVECIKVLASLGADLNIAKKDGYTPVHNAALQGHLSAVKCLIELGANPFLKNKEGKTPLDCAKKNNKNDVVEYLAKVMATKQLQQQQQQQQQQPQISPPLQPSLWQRLRSSAAANDDVILHGDLAMLPIEDPDGINGFLQEAGGNDNVARFLCGIMDHPSSSPLRLGYAALAIGRLSSAIQGFGQIMVDCDPAIGWRLFKLVCSSDNDEEVQYGAVYCLCELIDKVDDFGSNIMKSTPQLLPKLNSLKVHPYPDLAQSAARAAVALSGFVSSPSSPASVIPKMDHLSIHESYIIDRREVELGIHVKTGGFGEVFRGKWRGENVAIKRLLMKGSFMSRDATDEMAREAKLMIGLKSDYIVGFKGISFIEDRMCLITSWMDRGSLYDILHNHVEYKDISWKSRQSLALDAAKGLLFLHSYKILHRDMKSLNVLVNGDWRARLCDFGMPKAKLETLSKTATTSAGGAAAAGGSLRWMAPELLSLDPQFSFGSDIYGLGMVFWEISSRELPYDTADDMSIREEVKKGERAMIPEGCPAQFGELIVRCWAQQAEKRPSAQEVIDHLEGHVVSFEYPKYYPNWEEIEGNSKLSWTKPSTSSTFETVALIPGGRAAQFVQCYFGNPSTIDLVRIEAVRNPVLIAAFDQFAQKKQEGRKNGGDAFNAEFTHDGEKEKIFRDRFQPCFLQNTGLFKTHVLYGWHGCSVEAARSICQRGAQDFRKTDGGYFGAGMYLTLQSEYAAGYSTGTLNQQDIWNAASNSWQQGCVAGAGRNQVADKEYAMVLCQVCVGCVYPITRRTDYAAGKNCSEFYCFEDMTQTLPGGQVVVMKDANGKPKQKRADKAMKAGFDCHVITVSSRAAWQAAETLDPRQEGEMFDEIVVKESSQIVPVAVVYFKPKYPKT